MPSQILATWIRSSCLSTSLFEIFHASRPWLAGCNAYPVACRVFGLWPTFSNASFQIYFKSLEQLPKSCGFSVIITLRKHQILWYLSLVLSVTDICSKFSILLLKLILRLKLKSHWNVFKQLNACFQCIPDCSSPSFLPSIPVDTSHRQILSSTLPSLWVLVCFILIVLI